MIRVGFVLLSHTCPEQILALTQVLTELYDAPPIVCHHDFDQAPLSKNMFPSNVRFVEPHFPTCWGCFSIVPAALAAINLLMRGANPPDWFYLLSGSDYPTIAPEKALSILASSDNDVFIDHREIHYRREAVMRADEQSTGFMRPSYNSLAYKRYCAVAVPRPSLAKPLSFPPVGRAYLRHPAWRSVFPAPFGSGFRCFAGEHWFTANARAAEILLTETTQSTQLFQHLRTRECPEECYYHTVFANAPLKLENRNLRYIEWPSSEAWHPKTLAASDLPAIDDSQAHFARKVVYNSDLMHELNRKLGVGQPAFS
jgi:Core-2/I-Branching enzyme